MNYPLIILLSIATVLATRELSLKCKLGPVRASSLLSLVAGMIIYFLRFDPVYSATIIGASFAAMSTDKVIPTRFWMAVSGFIFALIFLNLSPDFFTGFGGKLGTIACLSVVMTLGVRKIARFYLKR